MLTGQAQNEARQASKLNSRVCRCSPNLSHIPAWQVKHNKLNTICHRILSTSPWTGLEALEKSTGRQPTTLQILWSKCKDICVHFVGNHVEQIWDQDVEATAAQRPGMLPRGCSLFFHRVFLRKMLFFSSSPSKATALLRLSTLWHSQLLAAAITTLPSSILICTCKVCSTGLLRGSNAPESAGFGSTSCGRIVSRNL